MRDLCAPAPKRGSSVLLTANILVWFAIGLTAQGQPPEQLPMPTADQLVLPPHMAGVADQELEGELIDEVIEPDLRFRLDPIRSLLVRTKQKVTRISIADPAVMDVTQYGPTEFEFYGKRSGETALTMWFTDETGQEQVLRYLVHVGTDQEQQARADLEYGELEDRLNELFPNSQIQLIPIADKLIIRGQARDAEEATRILSVIRAGGDQGGGGGGGGGAGAAAGAAAESWRRVPWPPSPTHRICRSPT